jgi:hypothetical protein
LKIANDCFRVVLAVFGGAVTYVDAFGGPSLVIFLRCFTVWENSMHGLTRWLAEKHSIYLTIFLLYPLKHCK